MGDTYQSTESFYNGGISSFKSDYGLKENGGTFTGQRMYATNLGFPGSTQTANQLGEAVNAVKQGVKSFEVTMGVADTAEQIPKQHFEEMRALMKLTGVTPSVHAPFNIDPSGFGEQGYDILQREENERRFLGTLEKAHQLNNDGNVTVVFHGSGGLRGTQYRPGDPSKNEKAFHAIKTHLVDQESGKMVPIEEERKFYIDHPEDLDPHGKGGTLHNPMEEVHSTNASMWRQKMTELANLQKMADEVMGNAPAFLAEYNNVPLTSENQKEVFSSMTQEQIMNYNKMKDASIFIQNANLSFNGAFNTAYKYGTDEQRGALKQVAEKYNELLGRTEENRKATLLDVSKQKEALHMATQALNEITSAPIKDKYTGEIVRGVPNLLVPIEDFAREKAAQTFGNLAWKGLKDVAKGDLKTAPIIAVENMFAGDWVHSTGDSLKALIEESRQKFVENAKGNGMGEGEAKKAAERLIGVTWDVGHLNMIKKHGFGDKEVIDFTKTIAPYVKHVHLTDNFGYADSHLAPGMGNVPLADIMKELQAAEKAGKLDMSRVSKIVEAPAFVQHFRKSPHSWTMAAMGSPVYGMQNGPYWNQVSAMANAGGGYFGSPLAQMPDRHFSTYGSGFSGLPSELGGSMGGANSRFSGTPNT